MPHKARNIGILGIEIAFPRLYVNQKELEVFDNVSTGKYTIGLGQENMSFVEPYEDVNSLSLTALKQLFEKYDIDPKNVGRLEVGTETLLDRSKSTKTVLMELFKESGNYDVEGVTTLNACYGGTSALFSAFDWVSSSAWDGRYAIVVCVDIAVYPKGPARSTGGAGAVAILIGQDAPLVFEFNRATQMTQVYDFYKPDPKSEYPIVDGQLSIHSYLDAVDNCYRLLQRKLFQSNGQILNINTIDYFCFHSPFNKMVQKSFYRMVQVDQEKQNLNDKQMQQLSEQLYKQKVLPSTIASKQLGNIYTGSLYAGLISLLDTVDLQGKAIALFSYGSGQASSLFILKGYASTKYIGQKLQFAQKLQQRIQIAPQEYDAIMDERQKIYGTNNFVLKPNFERLYQGAYYLSSIDNKWRRSYLRYQNIKGDKNIDNSNNNNNNNTLIQQNTDNIINKNNNNIDNNNNNNNNNNINNIKNSNSNKIQNSSNINSSINSKNKNSINDNINTLTAIVKSDNDSNNYDGNYNNTSQVVIQTNPIINDIFDIDLTKRVRSYKDQLMGNQVQQIDLTDQKHQYNKLWSGFYKKTIYQRLDQLQTVQQINVDKLKFGGLDIQRADLMIENCIGILGLPVGLALNFLINGKFYNIPMAIEEPSVIAAASSAAKLISEASDLGFSTYSTRPIMIGQIHLLDVLDCERVRCIIDKNKQNIIDYANQVAGNMLKRGGGTEDVRAHILNQNQISVDVYVNVCDSMGANIVNTIVEHCAPYIGQLTQCQLGIRVLTNLCEERRVCVQFEIDIEKMGWKGVSGEKVCQLILQAQNFAELDIYRAVTHNKGILNGITGVALATGQDCRAINASLHAHASKSGQYKPLTNYKILGDKFFGQICVPISVGTQGGAIPSNPFYQTSLDILGQPDAQKLGEIIVCTGLACNLAALRALCVEGIQRGHMALHAKNLALASGVPSQLVDEAVRFMKNRGRVRKETAEEFLKAYSIYKEVRQQNNIQPVQQSNLSTFSGEFYLVGLNERIDLHVVMNCGSEMAYHTSFSEIESTEGGDLRNYVFGEKGYMWIINFFTFIQEVRLDLQLEEHLLTKTLAYKLKLLSILINLIAFNLLKRNQSLTQNVINQITKSQLHDFHIQFEGQVPQLRYGLSLLIELVRIFKYNLDQSVQDNYLKQLLWAQLMLILISHVKTFQMWQEAKNGIFNIKEFLCVRQKRLSFTMMLLCDSLNLKQGIVTTQLLDQLNTLGDIQEKEITVLKDAHKWNQSSIIYDPNLYIYWLMQNNKLAQADNSDLIEQFLTDINQHKQVMDEKLPQQLKQLSIKATQIAKQYYKQEFQLKSKL